jgi:hypothetical protein
MDHEQKHDTLKENTVKNELFVTNAKRIEYLSFLSRIDISFYQVVQVM